MNSRRTEAMWLVRAVLLASLLAGPAVAGDKTSASFVLRGAHFNAGGNGALYSTAPVPGFGVVGATVGQSHPITPAGSATTLRTAWPGFWPLFAGELPTLDLDADARPTFLDNCPWWANAAQTPSFEDPAIGLACLCGDVDDDGWVTGTDEAAYRDGLAVPLGTAIVAPEKCSVIGDPRPCDVLDRAVVSRALLGSEPGIDQRCEAALPPLP